MQLEWVPMPSTPLLKEFHQFRFSFFQGSTKTGVSGSIVLPLICTGHAVIFVGSDPPPPSNTLHGLLGKRLVREYIWLNGITESEYTRSVDIYRTFLLCKKKDARQSVINYFLEKHVQWNSFCVSNVECISFMKSLCSGEFFGSSCTRVSSKMFQFLCPRWQLKCLNKNPQSAVGGW